MRHLFQAPSVALIQNLVATYHIISPKADTYVSHRWAHYSLPNERDLPLLSACIIPPFINETTTEITKLGAKL